MRASAWVVWAAVIAGACAPKGQPTLELKLAPKTVTDGTPVVVTVIGTAADGKIGTGTVKITSARGSLVTPVQVPFDSFGTATAELICDPTTEPECVQSVRVVAEWTSDKVDVTAEARLNSGGVSSGTGGGTGAGLGTADGGVGGGAGGAGGGSVSDAVYLTGAISGITDAYGYERAYGYAPLGRPTAIVGMIPASEPGGGTYLAYVLSRTGSLYYVVVNQLGAANRLMRLVPDAIEGLSGEANDVEVPHPCGSTGMVNLDAWPDTGAVVSYCYDKTHDDVRVAPSGTVRALGWDRHALVANGGSVEIWRDGAMVSAAAVANLGTETASANPAGFLVTNIISGTECEVLQISYAGVATSLGRLASDVPASLGGGSCCSFGGTLGRDGSLYTARGGGVDHLLRCGVDGSVVQVYSDSQRPPYPTPHLNSWSVMVP